MLLIQNFYSSPFLSLLDRTKFLKFYIPWIEVYLQTNLVLFQYKIVFQQYKHIYNSYKIIFRNNCFVKNVSDELSAWSNIRTPIIFWPMREKNFSSKQKKIGSLGLIKQFRKRAATWKIKYRLWVYSFLQIKKNQLHCAAEWSPAGLLDVIISLASSLLRPWEACLH